MADSDTILGGAEDGIGADSIPADAGAAFANLPGGEGGWLHQIVLFAAKEPWQFCWYVLMVLSPMFGLSAILSWKLAKAIDAQEKDKTKKNKKRINMNKVKKGKSD